MKALKLSSDLKYYNKNIVVIVCALVMLGAYFLASPWMQFDFSAIAASFGGSLPIPEGVDLPQGFTPPGTANQSGSGSTGTGEPPAGFTAPEGFEPPAGFTLPESGEAGTQGGLQLAEGFNAPGGAGGFPAAPEIAGRVLIPLGAVIALLGAVISAFRPRFNLLATALAVLAGLASLIYYGGFVAQDALIPINFIDMVTPGFWAALAGAVGLIVQVLLPRPQRIDENEIGNVRQLIQQPRRRSAMNLGQNVAVSFDALMANKLRSALTMLGIVIGVASVVSLLSVGQGAQAAVTEQIEGTGLNLLTISPGANRGPGGGGGGNTNTVTYRDAEAIAREIDGITAVLPQYSSSLQVRSDQESYLASVLGASSEYAEVRNIDIEIGRYFTQNEYRDGARVAVLGQQAAKDLFGGLNPIGRDIRISGKRFEVIGVLAQQDGGFGNDPNLQIHVPLTTGYRNLFDARAVASSDNTVSSIVVAVEDLDNVDAVTEDIESLLRRRHRLKDDEDNDFSVTDQQSLLDIASSITGILTVLLGAIASISLLVGGIGIMNITLVSVTERTKEIGLRKAIGARRSHILQQFLIETIVLSLLGGIIGVSLGVLIATLVNSSGTLNTTVTWDTIALGLGFSAVVGVFFGVYPANQAASLEPIEALRYE